MDMTMQIQMTLLMTRIIQRNMMTEHLVQLGAVKVAVRRNVLEIAI